MASLKALRLALKARIDTVPGFTNVYPKMPPTINPPCAIVMPDGIDFDSTGDGDSDDYRFAILVIVSKSWEETAQDKLDDFLARSGSGSVKAAIEGGAGDLGGNADYVHVPSMTDYGPIEIAGVTYIGAQLQVNVGSAG